MLKEFRDFILRGNVIDLAVAVVIGAAFKAIVDALVKDLITPLIAAIGGQPDFSAIQFTIRGSAFLIGDFINNVVSFLIIAGVIFFLVVKPMNTILARAARKTATSAPPAPTKEEVLLTEIRDALRAQNGGQAAHSHQAAVTRDVYRRDAETQRAAEKDDLYFSSSSLRPSVSLRLCGESSCRWSRAAGACYSHAREC